MSRSVEVITTLLNDYNTFLFSSLYTTSIIIVYIEVIKNIQYNIDIYVHIKVLHIHIIIVSHILYLKAFDSERTWWSVFQKRAGCTKLDIYVFFTNTELIPLLAKLTYFITFTPLKTNVKVAGKQDECTCVDMKYLAKLRNTGS
jgi:hypothetical protein